jgi:hypothetical protein
MFLGLELKFVKPQSDLFFGGRRVCRDSRNLGSGRNADVRSGRERRQVVFGRGYPRPYMRSEKNWGSMFEVILRASRHNVDHANPACKRQSLRSPI